MVVTRDVVFDAHRIPTEKYAEWRGYLQRVDALMNKRLRLAPTREGAARAAAKAVGR